MRLSVKIVGSFALIVLLSLGAAVGAGNRITRARYDALSHRRDVNRARSMARYLGEWIKVSAEEGGDLSGYNLDSILDFPPRERGRRSGGQQMGRMAGGGAFFEFDPLVITDPSGRVLWDTAGLGREHLNPNHAKPIEILSGENRLGYLYLGSMVPGVPPPFEQPHLRSAGMDTWIITMLIFFLALMLGILLTRHIVQPVKTLNSAAKNVGLGDLSVRVSEKRRDEMGDLARGFNAMTAALEDSDAQRRRMVADSAHELRTPVSLIRARIEMMEEGIYPFDKDGLAALSAESDRLSLLVAELKDLALQESPNIDAPSEGINFLSVVREALDAAAPMLNRRNLSAHRELAEGGNTIIGNRPALYRLVNNLLVNALRHARGQVLVVVNTLDSVISLRVEDDGPGIPENAWEKVFDRYFRVDRSRNRLSGGLGLGLALCREIVRNHGGRIHAEASKRLGGAALIAEFPVAGADPVSPSQQS